MTDAIAIRPVGTDIEKVLIGGDLTPLSPDQRLSYYNAICQSLGLNPLTKPFAYIMLNGKLQLYALKDCTEQLRKVHGVSITSVDPRQIGDLMVVVAAAADRDGRVDSSTGAVSVAALKGEALANAMMKAETKAKRRVTLSLCGLGMLDETEVQTLREQGVASEPQGNTWQSAQDSLAPAAVDPNAEPDIQPRSRRQPATATPSSAPAASSAPPIQPQGQVVDAEPSISPAQGKRFFAIMRSAGLSDEVVKARLGILGYHGSRDQMPKRIYEAAVDAIDPDFKFHTKK